MINCLFVFELYIGIEKSKIFFFCFPESGENHGFFRDFRVPVKKWNTKISFLLFCWKVVIYEILLFSLLILISNWFTIFFQKILFSTYKKLWIFINKNFLWIPGIPEPIFRKNIQGKKKHLISRESRYAFPNCLWTEATMFVRSFVYLRVMLLRRDKLMFCLHCFLNKINDLEIFNIYVFALNF